MDYMIIIKPDGTIEHKPYEGYGDITDTVGGLAENILYRIPISLPTGTVELDFYGNEEALLLSGGDIDKCNGLATFLYNNGAETKDAHPIYGNIAVLKWQVGEGDDVGFKARFDKDGELNISELWHVEDILLLVRNRNMELINEYREAYDDNKPPARMGFMSFNIENIDDYFENR